jgi:hypothetical protein
MSNRPIMSLVNFDEADSDLKARTDLFVINLNIKGRRNAVYGIDEAGLAYLIAGAWFSILNVPRGIFNLISKNKVDWKKVEEIVDKYYL